MEFGLDMVCGKQDKAPSLAGNSIAIPLTGGACGYDGGWCSARGFGRLGFSEIDRRYCSQTLNLSSASVSSVVIRDVVALSKDLFITAATSLPRIRSCRLS
ncbi:DNAJ heat shock N-terminal domain-containing protein [Striga asiatica]|uniref:DNAJ heat shock N-terminal domain-containing protein n=1 Tax=Striga asiatica TaxID=4170 RepID=A0A5A7PFT8_STRAF|nr:DNAJ heat shock N-terminal domain-containing protein [Striga asiatica]